jgi:hypothetical protein
MKDEAVTFPDARSVRFELGDGIEPVLVDLNAVVLVGEFTTEDGPFADDHLLAIWLENGRVIELPVVTAGIAELLQRLNSLAGANVEIALAAQSSFASRVMHPPALAGRELFEFAAVRKGVAGLIFKNAVERRLRPDVAAFLKARP